ncbi:uncharacterized protein LOC115760037 [Drosophila novamexicana]|uniref:Acylphosphatase-like domain-containing protein n=1 Tax=Drosophila virilis TaxID=7244 RepID=B4LT92_DROVI|nr:uncharacterized protein LOC6629255 [Drosophila virilis]XP_030557065.1 uncharacterized protein LOC115760037 [Drosophila novamexicana]EDW64934.1 uncharacterized protein Dvir_GJ19854 [Drosophila virilis]
MSLRYELSEPIAVYRVSYKLFLPDVKALMPRAAQKANELNVRGYMTYTQCGYAVSGELEGTQEKLEQMMSWLQQETPKGSELPQFGQYQLQLKPGYDDFFCC